MDQTSGGHHPEDKDAEWLSWCTRGTFWINCVHTIVKVAKPCIMIIIIIWAIWAHFTSNLPEELGCVLWIICCHWCSSMLKHLRRSPGWRTRNHLYSKKSTAKMKMEHRYKYHPQATPSFSMLQNWEWPGDEARYNYCYLKDCGLSEYLIDAFLCPHGTLSHKYLKIFFWWINVNMISTSWTWLPNINCLVCIPVTDHQQPSQLVRINLIISLCIV